MFLGPVDLDHAVKDQPVPVVRELDLTEEFTGGLKLSERPKTIAWQLAQKPEPKKAKALSPEAQAYTRLGLELKQIPEENRFTKKEAEAFNTMYDLFKPGKLSGADGKFTKGDVKAILKSLEPYQRFFAGKILSLDKDLLAGKHDSLVRDINSGELLAVRSAKNTLIKYAKGKKNQPKNKRFIAYNRKLLITLLRAFLLGTEIPKEMPSRALR